MHPFGTSGHSRYSPFLVNNTERSAYGEPDTTIWAELVQRLEDRLTSALQLSATSSPWWNMTTDDYPIEQEHQQEHQHQSQDQHPYQHLLHPAEPRAATTTQHPALLAHDARGETASGTTLLVQSRARSSSSSGGASSTSSVLPIDVVGTAADPIKPTTLPELRPDAARLRTHSWIVNHSDSMEDDSISPVHSLPSGSDGNKKSWAGGVVPRTPYARVPTESAFEMAYFLKNTGPNMPVKVGGSGSSDGAGAKRKTRHRSMFKILGGTKGRKSLAERVGTVEHHPEKETATTKFVPPEGVVQKVSSEGKKYLQIVTGNEPAGSQPYQIAPTKSNEPWKKRTSATLPEQFSSLGTDTFDTWLSTLGLQNFDQVVESVHQAPPELPRVEAREPKKLRQTSSASALDTLSTSDRRSEYAIKLVQEPEEEQSNGNSTVAKDALSSNPPDTTAAPEADLAPASPSSVSTSKDIDELPSQVARRLREMSSCERLSGQGFRRPSRERPQSQIILARSSSLEEDVNGHNRVDSLMNRSDTASSSPERHALRGRSLDGLTRNGSREDKIRARKIRDLNRTRGIDAIVRKPLPSERLELAEMDRATATTCDHLERAKLMQQQKKERGSSISNDSELEARRPSSLHLAPPSQVPAPTPTSTTGYTPVSGAITFSPVVTVAEQRPLPRANRIIKKPARLVLRDTSHRLHRPSAIAVRSSNANGRYSRDDSVLALASEQRVMRASRDELGGRTAPRARRASSLKFVPGATEAAGTSRMSRGTLRTPSAMSVATSVGGVAASEAARTSKVRSLEARVEALERQNRLLEAALQAVLKTSGEMKRCACEARKEEEEEVERKRSEGGRVWSGGSALDVWLETRMGRGSDGSVNYRDTAM